MVLLPDDLHNTRTVLLSCIHKDHKYNVDYYSPHYCNLCLPFLSPFYPLPIGCGAFLTPTMFTHFYLLNFSMSVIIFTALCNSFPQRIPTMGIMSTIFTFGHLISLRLFSSKIQMPIATSSLTAPAYFFFFNSIVNAPANIGSSLNCCGANPISALASIKS